MLGSHLMASWAVSTTSAIPARMSGIDSPLSAARVVGPKITFSGFEEKASIGSLKLITATQKIGNAARMHQKVRKPAVVICKAVD